MEVDPVRVAIGACAASGGTHLNLSNLGLSSLPEDVFQFQDSLELLNLGGNALTGLPDRFRGFAKLRILFFAGNGFTEFPAVLGKLPSLFMVSFKSNALARIPEEALAPSVQWLILTDNRLTSLPESMGRLSRLRKLMLAGNQLASLPDAMQNCRELELVRLSSNRLTSLPKWFLQLPNITWLAAGGNPVLPAAPLLPPLGDAASSGSSKIQLIPFQQLTLLELLGEGASGFVYRARWARSDDRVDTVAIKVFKGAMTSDGLPMDELRATLQLAHYVTGLGETGDDDYPITPVLGVVGENATVPFEGSDEMVSVEAGALVMELIPKEFALLGDPPSFETMTRDTFPGDHRRKHEVAREIGQRVAHSVLELHAANLTHGDVYAHNLLVASNDTSARVRLCDLGAATHIPSSSSLDLSKSLKAIELRAVAKLMDDIHTHVATESRIGEARDFLLSSARLFLNDSEAWALASKQPTSPREALERIQEFLKVGLDAI